MAVCKMKLVNISGRMDCLDAVTRVCGHSGVFQPENTLSFYSDTSALSLVREENPFTPQSETVIGSLLRAGLIPDAQAVPSSLTDQEISAFITDFSSEIDGILDEKSAFSARMDAVLADMEQFEHFKGLNIDLDSVLHCQLIKVRFGRLPIDSYRKLSAYEDNPYVLFFPSARDSAYYWGVYFVPVDFAEEVDRIFSGLYFERMRVAEAEGTPDEILAAMAEEKRQLQEKCALCDRRLQEFWKEQKALCSSVLKSLEQRAAFFDIRRYAARYGNHFVLNGWVSAREEAVFSKELSTIDGIEVTFKRADEDSRHTPPVALHNLRLFRPFEYFVQMYGLPSYHEIDPTAFLAITYTLLFGVMFGDVGQGILLALVGWLMWKWKRMDIGRILIPCGCCSAVFGLLYGSVFGFEHLLDPLYRSLLHLEEKPVEVMASATAIRIILAAVVIGCVLLVIAMLLNIVSALKRRDYESGIFGASGIAGLVFYISLIIGLVGQLVLGWHVMTAAYVWLLLILPVVLIFLREPLGRLLKKEKDWMPEKWGDFILQNFFELFETMLSYLSNTMSFLRVGAFVLVHAGMMLAVFALAGLFGPIGYAVTVVLGNLLVMVMEALLVAIQVMRLQFYELFSRYYIGEGRAFDPIRVS